MKKILSVLLCFVLSSVFLVGCSGEKKEEDSAKKEEKIESITVATSPGYAPFEFEENGELKGYEIDIWKEIEKRTGIKVNWEYADFSGLLGLLQSKKADVVSAQMSPDEEREKIFDFSDPISYSSQVLIVKEDNDEIKGIDDLAGKKVGIGSGNSSQSVIEEKYPNGEVKIENYTSATFDNQFKDLEYGRLDVVLAQDIQVLQMIKAGTVKCKILDKPIQSAPACFIVNKGEEQLVKIINDCLTEMREDGTLLEISNKWLGSDITKERK